MAQTIEIDMVEVLRPALDRLTQEMTGFESFQALTDAKGYRPTLRGRAQAVNVLADNYDVVMERRDDPRRAQRG